MLKQFKLTYKRFIYAANWAQSIEFSMQTAACMCWLEILKIMEPKNVEKIRKFMLENLAHDQEWKNRLIRLTI